MAGREEVVLLVLGKSGKYDQHNQRQLLEEESEGLEHFPTNQLEYYKNPNPLNIIKFASSLHSQERVSSDYK